MYVCVCVSARASPACLCATWKGLHINGFHTSPGRGEAKAFENEKQSDAGGGDRARGNLDSPVVYL